MQTFLPYPSFIESAKCLDYRRLGKQRVEARQILRALRNGGTWKNHPAVRMWAGYELALSLYGDTMIQEWTLRGYVNNMELICPYVRRQDYPQWFGDWAFHSSHRSNLLRKDRSYYGRFGWSESDTLPYVWPV